jgi:hypothetical protein
METEKSNIREAIDLAAFVAKRYNMVMNILMRLGENGKNLYKVTASDETNDWTMVAIIEPA